MTSQNTLKQTELGALVHDKLVLVALPGSEDWVGPVRALGARDVLLLTRRGQEQACRHPTHVELRYERLRDVRNSNCEVAILNAEAALFMLGRRNIRRSRFRTVLVPVTATLPVILPTILYYAQRRRFRLAGMSTIAIAGRQKKFLVLEIHRKTPLSQRLFAPAHLASSEIFERMRDIDYVALRAVDRIERNDPYKDIDLLVSDASLPRLKELLSQEVGTSPIDVYSETGADGHAFNSVPYFVPALARRMLSTAIVRPSGIRVCSPLWQYLSLAYHLVFHGKSSHIRPGAEELGPDTWDKASHFDELARCASEAGLPIPRTFGDIDQALREHRAFPGRDLMGFYARRNPFVAARYIHHGDVQAGLATFFIRDFGQGLGVVPAVREQLERHFEILIEGPVTEPLREAVIGGVRGGNWSDPQAPGGRAEPIYWLVCWDPAPRRPSRATRRKHPHVDNEHVRVKDFIRSEIGAGGRKVQPVVHSSDNALEALEHVRLLGREDALRTHPLWQTLGLS